MNLRRISMMLVLLLAVISAVYLALPKKDEPFSIKLVYCHDPVVGCGDDRMQVRFSRLPKVLQPFGVEMRFKEAKQVRISFAMASMEMGMNRYRMLQEGDGSWHAEVTLPVCVQGRSDWQALVEVETPAGTERYQFGFTAER